MSEPWIYRLDAGVLCLLLGLAMMLAAVAAGLLAKSRPLLAESRLGPIEASLFGLLALLLAFSFSGAASRYDARAGLMVDAANAMQGAILRADLYPEPVRTAMRTDLREYLEAQISFYETEGDDGKRDAAIARSNAIQQRLWARVSSLAHDPALGLPSVQNVGALDKLFTLTASRQIAARTHTPVAILLLLFVISVATAYTSAYAAGSTGKFSWPGYVGYSLLTALVIYITLDLDQPGRGLIRRDVQEQAFLALRVLLAG
ncbi:hypothetical protein [Chitinimonas naiadis]